MRSHAEKVSPATRDHASAIRALGIKLVEDGGWRSYQFLEDAVPDVLLEDERARRGLWKRVPGPVPGVARCRFDLPPGLADSADIDYTDSTATDPSDACLDWVLTTARGELPHGWEPPEQAEVDAWVPRGSRTLQVGPFVRQATVHLAGGRLAVAMPVVATSGELSAHRRACLRVVLEDAQVRWRMIRLRATPLALAEGGAGQVIAEADLTGAPRGWQPQLVACGLDALRCVVSWLILSAGLLADARVACQAWDHDCSAGFTPAADPEGSV
jgi:hypothetical protein